MFDNQRLIKIAHNRVICDQETAWLKKIDSQTTICKILLSDLTDVRRLLCRVRVGMVRGRPQPMWMHGETRGIMPSLQIPEDPFII